MFKSLLLLAIFSIFPVKAQVLSGHQEFVHYSSEQKEQFIIGVMELMIELENKFETASVPQKAKYSLLLKQLNEFILSSAQARESTDLNIYAKDLTRLLDPNRISPKRCIYGGWVSKTVTQGKREICQHPNHISGGLRSAETIAYKQSSSCGTQNRNTISCNPAIFGFKNKSKGSQFCVPAGPAKSENSSYACMQLSLGIKTEAGADPASERIEQLKKNFEGNPELVNNLFGFIYKTCICDTQENEVINPVYLSNVRPHRTCLGLINTIAEVNHCVEFGTVKSSDMDFFKELRNFANDIAGRAQGAQVDSEYTKLLQSMKTRFSSDYGHMCGGEQSPPPGGGGIDVEVDPDRDPPAGSGPGQEGGDGNGDNGGDTNKDEAKSCSGECELTTDGKFTNCTFKSGDDSLEVTPPDDGASEFTTQVGEEKYLCKISEKAFDHQTSCQLTIQGNLVSYQLLHPESFKVAVKSTKWTPTQDAAVVESVEFADHDSISLSVEITVNGTDAGTVDCGSEKNPKSGKIPHIELIPEDSEDDSSQKFKTKVTPDDKGWIYVWSRVDAPAPKDPAPKINIQGDSDVGGDENPDAKKESDGSGEQDPDKKSNDDLDDKDKDKDKDKEKKLDGAGKDRKVPKEKSPYQVCVKLVKESDPNIESNKPCRTVDKTADDAKANAIVAPAKSKFGGPQINMPQLPVRQGVDFSAGGIL